VVIYIFVDNAEDMVIGRFGKVIGVTHAEVETIGKILTKTWYDDVLFLIARSVPFIPSVIVSVVAGTIKYNFRSYVLYTFFGFCILCSFYLWVGFVGIEAAQALWEYAQGNTLFRIIFFIVALGILYLLKKVKDHIWNILFKKAAKHTEK
jgi:membrane protein DedA with SNARE-associated domain